MKLALPLFYVVVLVIIGAVFLLPKLFPGNTAPYDAIDDGDTDEVRALLEAGADPNSRARGVFAFRSSRYLSPPMLFAMERSQPEIAVLLLASGADPNVRDARGRPALFVAAGAEKPELVRALLAKGADVHAISTDGESALRVGPKGPGGQYPGSANHPKDLMPDIRAMLVRAGARE